MMKAIKLMSQLRCNIGRNLYTKNYTCPLSRPFIAAPRISISPFGARSYRRAADPSTKIQQIMFDGNRLRMLNEEIISLKADSMKFKNQLENLTKQIDTFGLSTTKSTSRGLKWAGLLAGTSLVSLSVCCGFQHNRDFKEREELCIGGQTACAVLAAPAVLFIATIYYLSNICVWLSLLSLFSLISILDSM